MLAQHEGGRHQKRANLVQRQRANPELVVTTQDDQHGVAFAHALRNQEVSALVRPVLHVAKGKAVLLTLGVAPYHGRTLGLDGRDVVNYVIRPVEGLGIVEGKVGDLSVAVAAFGEVVLAEIAHDEFSFAERYRGGMQRRPRVRDARGSGIGLTAPSAGKRAMPR